MTETQPWYFSRTVWASLIAVVSVIAGYFRYEIAEADQAALVDAATSIVGVVAGLIAVWTRITATKQISTPGKP